MPVLIQYLIKLSISLALVYLFYQLVLRRLTFYSWNRWYLLGYTALSFCIPFIDVTGALEKNDLKDALVIRMIPGFTGSLPPASSAPGWLTDKWNIILSVLLTGVLILLVRFLMQVIAYRKMKAGAKLIFSDKLTVYQVDKNIIPFSFGSSVYLNAGLHTKEDLEEIIRHEFVHIRQRHTADVIWMEFLCMINWYNPFVWLIRKAVRQNLEFIADQQVIENGADKKQYQYLLLKVIGNSSFSIASNFNFSSLKKRIAMMNKMRSAKLHLVKFLFILPVLAVMLLAFRSKLNHPGPRNKINDKVFLSGLVVDAITKQPLENATLFCKEMNAGFSTDKNGYFKAGIPYKNEELTFSLEISKPGYTGFSQHEHWGNFTSSVLYEKYGHTIEFFGLSPENSNTGGFSFIPGNPQNEEGLNYEQVLHTFQSVDWQAIQKMYNGTDTVPQPAPPPPPPPAKTGTLPPPPPPAKKENVFTQNGSDKKLNDKIYYLLDGKEVTAKEVINLDQNVILSVNVLKEEEAVSKYGNKAKDGAIIVTTKESSLPHPLYVIDGTVSTKEEADKMDPDKIESINVLKNGSATQKYGDKGKNGVIEITTKKKETSASEKFMVSADYLAWNSKNKILTFAGHAEVIYEGSKTISSDSIEFHNSPVTAKLGKDPLVLADGKEMNPARNINISGKKYRVEMMGPDAAVKLYGDKAKDGVILVSAAE